MRKRRNVRWKVGMPPRWIGQGTREEDAKMIQNKMTGLDQKGQSWTVSTP